MLETLTYQKKKEYFRRKSVQGLPFVRQMKLILGNGIPPWMDYLFEEFETYKGINENVSPLKERIIDHYHMSTTYAPAHYGTKKQ